MKLITSPQPAPETTLGSLFDTTLFLGGSIEQGKASEWQKRVIQELKDTEQLTIFNPRREVWDATWSQSPDNKKLREQIRWELDRIDECDIILLYFQAGTMSPITLLELGICLGSKHRDLIVVCEPGFWREANVVESCEFFNKKVLVSLDEAIKILKSSLN